MVLRSKVKESCYCYILARIDEILVVLEVTTYYRISTRHILSNFMLLELLGKYCQAIVPPSCLYCYIDITFT